jgi:hypothetical protein
LPVGIDDDDRAETTSRGNCREIQGGRRLADAALEIRDDDVHGPPSLLSHAHRSSDSMLLDTVTWAC